MGVIALLTNPTVPTQGKSCTIYRTQRDSKGSSCLCILAEN